MSKESESKKAMDEGFVEVDVNIPFFKILDSPFQGVLIEKEEREEKEAVLLAILENDEKVYLGGYAIIKFFEQFYVKGSIARIEFVGKVKTKSGREVNDYKFSMKK